MKKKKTFADLYIEAKQKPTAAQEFITRIADKVGKSEHTVRQWICGKQKPDKANRGDIAELLNANVQDLFPELETN